jgi:hypothetical protein
MPIHEKFDSVLQQKLNYHKSIFSPRSLALVTVFAALNLIVDIIPFSPTIGVPGTFFRLGWVLSPITGILLGPVAGGISCIIAGSLSIAMGIQPWTFGIFTPFRSGLSALQSGLLAQNRWKLALALLSFLIGVWFVLPNGREAWPLTSFHIVGVLFIVILRSKIRTYIHSPDLDKIALGISIAAYCGNISRHLLGNTILLFLLDLSPLIFISAIPLTVIEQLTFTIASAILGGTIIKTSIHDILLLNKSKANNL